MKLPCQDKKKSQRLPYPPEGFESNYAAIDIGSHTIRLMIAQLRDRFNLTPICVERAITRLAKNFQNGQNLSFSSMQESTAILKSYDELLRQHGVKSLTCGATGVMRRASNAAEFQKIVKQSTGLDLDILTERSEAMLSAKGILSVLQTKGDILLLFDLGGSSLEFLLIDPMLTEPLWDISVFIGASTLTEKHLSGNPPKSEQVSIAGKAILDQLSPVLDSVRAFLMSRDKKLDDLELVGTAGTVTTLAAMYLQMEHYEPHRVNGIFLKKDWLQTTTEQLKRLPFAERRNIAGLERGREDIILGGALIVLEILNSFKKSELTVTDAGLLEGLLLNLVEKERGMLHTPLRTPLTWDWQKS